MRTLADFKQLLRPGMVFHCENYARSDISGKRVVVEVQPGGLWYTRPDHPTNMYLKFPRKKDVEITNDAITFMKEGKKRFTFYFGKEAV